MVGSFGREGFPRAVQSPGVTAWPAGCTDPPLSALMYILASRDHKGKAVGHSWYLMLGILSLSPRGGSVCVWLWGKRCNALMVFRAAGVDALAQVAYFHSTVAAVVRTAK